MLVAFLPSKNEPKEENPAPAATEPEQKEDTTEYFAKELLKKAEYIIEDINLDGFTYGNLTYTGNKDVKLHQVVAETLVDPDTIIVNVSNDKSTITVNIAPTSNNQTVKSTSAECESNASCDSDYIDGAKTLLTATSNASGTDYAFYSYTKANSLISYKTRISNKDSIDESTVRSLLIKAAMTISDKSDKPYVFDMAARLKFPNGKRVKSYKDINQIIDNAVVIMYDDQSIGSVAYIYIEQEPIADVTTTEVSKKPKIEKFTYNNRPYFRFYDGDSSLDVRVYIDNDRGLHVDDLENIQKYIDAIGK